VHRTDAAALVALAIITMLVAWNRLSFDAWLTRFDLYTFFLPWYTFLGERLRDFAVPGWNPHLFSGTPFAGDPESGWMYLPAMLAFALLSAASAFKAMVAAQLAIVALTTYAFARTLGMGAPAALVAAVLYLTGPFLHWNTYCCLIFSQFATWIPLALLGIELALRTERWPYSLAGWGLGGLAVSQMLAGWVGEGWLYAMLLPAAYTVYRALLSPPRPGIPFVTRLLRGAATGVAVLGLGLALGAAGLLPRLAVNAETNLAGGDYSQLGSSGVLNPPWTLRYLLVQVLGEGTGYHYRAAAFGGAAIILSLLAIFLVRGRFAVPFFAALTLIALILTLDTTPLHLLFYLIPRYREFHDHDAWRVIALAAIGPAMLSGAAIVSLPSWRGRRDLLPVVVLPLLLLIAVTVALWRDGTFLGWPPLIAAAVTTALVAVVVMAPAESRSRGVEESSRRRQDGKTASHLVGATPASPEPEPAWPGWPSPPPPDGPHPLPPLPLRWERGIANSPDRLAWVMGALILAVAFVQPAGLELSGSWLGWPRDPLREARWRPDQGSAAALATEISPPDSNGAGAFLQAQVAASGPFRYAGYAGFGYTGDKMGWKNYMERRYEPNIQAILVNGRPIYLGLFDIQGYNPLHLSRYDEFMTALNNARQDYHTAFLLPSAGSPLLDLLDVRYLLVDATLPQDREDVAALTAGRHEVFRTPEVVVYERDVPLPHAWIVHDVRPAARGEALAPLASRAVDPYQTAFVEGTPPATAAPVDPAAESARVTRYSPDALTIETNAAAPVLLVVSEVYESGWKASVDGAAVPILATDHALRGVPLPAGAHTVELRYQPLSLTIGLPLSLITAAAMLVVFVIAGWTALMGRSGRP
jgi:hypothetical protein